MLSRVPVLCLLLPQLELSWLAWCRLAAAKELETANQQLEEANSQLALENRKLTEGCACRPSACLLPSLRSLMSRSQLAQALQSGKQQL